MLGINILKINMESKWSSLSLTVTDKALFILICLAVLPNDIQGDYLAKLGKIHLYTCIHCSIPPTGVDHLRSTPRSLKMPSVTQITVPVAEITIDLSDWCRSLKFKNPGCSNYGRSYRGRSKCRQPLKLLLIAQITIHHLTVMVLKLQLMGRLPGRWV